MNDSTIVVGTEAKWYNLCCPETAQRSGKAVNILNQAASLVGGDRDRVHGDKQETFEKIATLWNAWLKVRKEPAAPLTAHDVAIMMASMKAARTQNGEQNPDDYVDMAGYAACAGELA